MLIWIIALVAAALCAVLRCATEKYIFSPLTTLFCALAALAASPDFPGAALAAAFLVSIAGDWLLAHQDKGKDRFVKGVAGFLAGHLLFALFAFLRFGFSLPALVIALALAAFYAVLLPLRYFKAMDSLMRYAVAAYMLVSIVSLFAAMSINIPIIPKILYVAGIASIVFSDTMIGESEFAGVKRAGKLILPTYYACHLLVALAACLI